MFKWSEPEINCSSKEKTWGGLKREQYLEWSVGIQYNFAWALFEDGKRDYFDPGMSLRQQINKFGKNVIGIWVEFGSIPERKCIYVIPLDDSYLENNYDK